MSFPSSVDSPLSRRDDVDDDEVVYPEMVPPEDDTGFHFGLRGPPVETEFAFAASSTSRVLRDDVKDEDDEETIHFEVVPKHDEEQYQFGMAAATPKRAWDFTDPSQDNSNKTRRVVLKHRNDDDDEDVAHYEVLPKHDSQQFHFGMAAVTRNFSFAATPSMIKTKTTKKKSVSSDDDDDDDTIHFDVVPKQDAEQFQFGLLAAKNRTFEFGNGDSANENRPQSRVVKQEQQQEQASLATADPLPLSAACNHVVNHHPHASEA